MSADGTKVMRAHMLPFSCGARMSLSRTFALAELRLTLASVARHFGRMRLAPPAGRTDANMQMCDHFSPEPCGQRCMLVKGRKSKKIKWSVAQ